MAYQTGSATSMIDLLTKLSVFAVANGWTEDELDNGAGVAGEGRFALSKNNIFVSFKWNATTPLHLSVHQATAYSGANHPGEHTNDSGNGYNDASGRYSNTNLLTERCVSDLGDGPFPSYYFFENDASPAYLHVVVEKSSQTFRHFGMGEMEKFNDWTGGEYAYGHYHLETTGVNNIQGNNGNSCLLDGFFQTTGSGTAKRAATIRAEGFPHQGGSEKWLQCGGYTTFTSEANWRDTAGNIKRVANGGFRAGPLAYSIGQFSSNVTTGHIPLYALGLFLRDFTNSFVYFLGTVPDIRGVHLLELAAKQEVTIGSDTWVMFPTARRTNTDVENRTNFQGIAYKKVTA